MFLKPILRLLWELPLQIRDALHYRHNRHKKWQKDNLNNTDHLDIRGKLYNANIMITHEEFNLVWKYNSRFGRIRYTKCQCCLSNGKVSRQRPKFPKSLETGKSEDRDIPLWVKSWKSWIDDAGGEKNLKLYWFHSMKIIVVTAGGDQICHRNNLANSTFPNHCRQCFPGISTIKFNLPLDHRDQHDNSCSLTFVILMLAKKVPRPSLVLDSGDHNCTVEATRRCILAVEGSKTFTWNLNKQNY